MSHNTSAEKAIPQLIMLRPDLENLPGEVPPAPYGIRCEVPGDGKAWEKIITAAFKETASYRTITEDASYRPERVLFVTDGKGMPVATAAAWTTPDYPEACAVLHMVGVLPEHSGHRLGRYVVAAALQQARREGFTRMALKTDKSRIPAIKTYLGLGFLPVVVHESHIDCWKGILRSIEREDLLAVLPPAYDGTTAKTL